MKWWEKVYDTNTENSHIASIGAIFTSTYYTKQLIHDHTNSSASELFPVVCFSRGDEAIFRLPEHSWMLKKPQKQATAKVAWDTLI